MATVKIETNRENDESTEIADDKEPMLERAPLECPVNFQNPRGKEMYHWHGHNTCTWRSPGLSEDRRLVLYKNWKTCFLCKRKGCRFCVVSGDGLKWSEPIDFICESCYDEKFEE